MKKKRTTLKESASSHVINEANELRVRMAPHYTPDTREKLESRNSSTELQRVKEDVSKRVLFMRDRASVQTIKLASSENNSKIAVKAFQGSSKEAFPLDALPTGEAALEFKIDDSFNFIRPKSRIMTAHSTRNHNKNPSNVSVVKKLE